jgi:pteridine reductase
MSTRTRIALVTGGARRVGSAIVQRLDADGFCVAFTYHRSAREAKRLERSLTNRGLAISADLTRPEEACRAIVGAVSSAHRRLDVLVNSASIYEPGDEKLHEMMAIHVEAPLLLCRRFEKYLRQSRGHVVNMVDLLAERPWPKYAAYCASKAALWSQTIAMARELAPEVTVNGIAPGVVAWPDDFPQAQRKKYLQRVPLGRAGTPEEVASLVHFLVSEGTYITGQIIRLDGGRSIT